MITVNLKKEIPGVGKVMGFSAANNGSEFRALAKSYIAVNHENIESVVDTEVIEHVVTENDLAANPELAEEVKVGETIKIPVEDVEDAAKEADELAQLTEKEVPDAVETPAAEAPVEVAAEAPATPEDVSNL